MDPTEGTGSTLENCPSAGLTGWALLYGDWFESVIQVPTGADCFLGMRVLLQHALLPVLLSQMGRFLSLEKPFGHLLGTLLVCLGVWG